MDWYLKVIQQYADFSGRARRKEYWMFYLFNMLIPIPLAIIDIFVFNAAETGILVLTIIYGLVVAIPGLAVTVRRLHDTGRSGWWIFISAVPFVGGFILLFFLIQDSESRTNQWGANPKMKLTGAY